MNNYYLTSNYTQEETYKGIKADFFSITVKIIFSHRNHQCSLIDSIRMETSNIHQLYICKIFLFDYPFLSSLKRSSNNNSHSYEMTNFSVAQIYM